ncbi:hypothetical protein [Roseovarius ramblicola]|uniref:Uncharacterized protein n=1 Tax=Roseovarius ramblicola TaxID=2022336 RepID=A0ABV5HYY8_9RHOB
MSTLETMEPKHGERRRIGDDDCVWIAGYWERVATVRARLSDRVALQQSGALVGLPEMARVNRQEIAHCRELLRGVAA